MVNYTYVSMELFVYLFNCAEERFLFIQDSKYRSQMNLISAMYFTTLIYIYRTVLFTYSFVQKKIFVHSKSKIQRPNNAHFNSREFYLGPNIASSLDLSIGVAFFFSVAIRSPSL